VATFQIVEHLNVAEYILFGVSSWIAGSPPYQLSLKQVEEAFRDRVVLTIPEPTYRMFQIVRPEE